MAAQVVMEREIWSMEKKQSLVMFPVTLTDVPTSTSEEMKDSQPVVSVIRYANFRLQDGTNVVLRNTTYEKMIYVYQKLFG